MAFYQFERTQYVKASIDELWEFVSSPRNLPRISPDYMGFKITSKDLSEHMYEGILICYQINPLPLYSTTWVTEITRIKEKCYFIDEQRKGPYRLWHHEHWLEPSGEGVFMKDKVSYIPPLGVLGKIANQLVIKNKLKDIFDYREKAINRIFK